MSGHLILLLYRRVVADNVWSQINLPCISFVSCMPSCCSAPSLPAVGSISINTGLILLLHICMQTHEKQDCPKLTRMLQLL